MGMRIIKVVGGLTALYLVLEHYTGFKTAIGAGAAGASTVEKTLQGR